MGCFEWGGRLFLKDYHIATGLFYYGQSHRRGFLRLVPRQHKARSHRSPQNHIKIMTADQKTTLLLIWGNLDNTLQTLNDLAPEIKNLKEAAKVDEAITGLTKAVSCLVDLLPNE